jgi:hypothetical protein
MVKYKVRYKNNTLSKNIVKIDKDIDEPEMIKKDFCIK